MTGTLKRRLLTICETRRKHEHSHFFAKNVQNTEQGRNNWYTLFSICHKFAYMLCSHTEYEKAANTIPCAWSVPGSHGEWFPLLLKIALSLSKNCVKYS